MTTKKDTEPRAPGQPRSRPLCYCFGHSIEDVEAEVAAGGPDAIRQSIVARCRLGEARCAETNPKGSCCLGDVARAYSQARLASDGADEGAAMADCCAPSPAVGTTTDTVGEEPSRAGLASGGAVLAAALASACCWLPLALLALGTSAAGAAAFFESVRPYFLSAAGVLLAVGFYLTYFRREPCAPETECAPASPGQSRTQRIMLWSAAALTLALALFPTYVEHLIDGDGIGAKAGISGEVRTFRVDGMTCSGCAGGLASRLQGLPGVLGAEVNYEAGLARVEIESERNDGAVLDAIAAAGFQGAPND